MKEMFKVLPASLTSEDLMCLYEAGLLYCWTLGGIDADRWREFGGWSCDDPCIIAGRENFIFFLKVEEESDADVVCKWHG